MPVTFIDLLTAPTLEVYLEPFQATGQLSSAHRVILQACFQNPDLAPFLKAATPEELALKWLQRYQSGFDNRISQRISRAPRTVPDPIIEAIIQARLPNLTADHLNQIKFAHRLAMSAENIQGLLLEEFLAEQLADYGWHCCWGEVLRHVDFCHQDGELLQVKNRSNSENSSSSRVRLNQPIDKWYRVNAQSGTFQWSYFNQKYATERFSEAAFVEFVRRVLAQNPAALAIEADNPWPDISAQG